jgi:hypothetical protein
VLVEVDGAVDAAALGALLEALRGWAGLDGSGVPAAAARAGADEPATDEGAGGVGDVVRDGADESGADEPGRGEGASEPARGPGEPAAADLPAVRAWPAMPERVEGGDAAARDRAAGVYADQPAGTGVPLGRARRVGGSTPAPRSAAPRPTDGRPVAAPPPASVAAGVAASVAVRGGAGRRPCEATRAALLRRLPSVGDHALVRDLVAVGLSGGKIKTIARRDPRFAWDGGGRGRRTARAAVRRVAESGGAA